MTKEEIEEKLNKLKESNRKISIRYFIGEKFTKEERFAVAMSGKNLTWYFDEKDSTYIFFLDGNTSKAYMAEIDVDLGWNEIVINYDYILLKGE